MQRIGVEARAGGGEASDIALCTDRYEITMAASYLALGIDGTATYSLFARRLPPRRSSLIAAGIIEEAVRRLRAFAFDRAALDYLRSTGAVREDALHALGGLRFTGDVWAVGAAPSYPVERSPVLAERRRAATTAVRLREGLSR